MAQPLYFVARKCRDQRLRMRAIGEMKKVGDKGIYTRRTVAKVAEWVVTSEIGVSAPGSFVPEERRLRDVCFWLRSRDEVWESRGCEEKGG